MTAKLAAQILPSAIAALRAAGVADPARDARRLLAHALDLPPDRLTLHLQDPLAPVDQARFERLVQARCQRQPVAQIIGQRAFFGRRFRVTPAVLDPRPETETLVEAALEGPFAQVLDLGTGSGAILLTLLAERPGARGLGVDLSPAALAVARDNRDQLGLAGRARLALSDWLSAVSGRFDLVVCNPPYIDAADHDRLDPDVRDWEPAMALTPGPDGLSVYRALIPQLCRVLADPGRALFEVGAGQAQAVAEMLRRAGFVDVAIRQDLDGRGRVVGGHTPQNSDFFDNVR